MRIRLLKLIDRLMGVILTAYLPSASLRPFPAPRRFLVIRPGGIGDAVLLIPTILLLKKNYPEAQIILLAEKRNGAVFNDCSAISDVLCYENPRELLTAIRGQFDVVIDTEQWHRLSAVVARLTGAPMLIGYATNERQRLFSHPIPYCHDEYEVESFYHLLAPLHIVPPEPVPLPFLHITPDLEQRAGALLGQLGESPFVVIFPGASIPERRWGADRFRQVVAQLAEMGIPAVVVGGKEDTEDGRAIIAATNGLNLAGKTSLAESAAVIEKGAVLLSGDSGILHIGVGLGKPTVSLFGPGIEKKWAPHGENHIVINKHLPCSPCTKFG